MRRAQVCFGCALAATVLMASLALFLAGCTSRDATASDRATSTASNLKTSTPGPTDTEALESVKDKLLAGLADPNLKPGDIRATMEAPETAGADVVVEWPSGRAEVDTVGGRVHYLAYHRSDPEKLAPQPGMDDLQAMSLKAAQVLGWEDRLPKDILSPGGDSVSWLFTPPYTYTWTWPEYDAASDTMKAGSFQVVTDSLGRLRGFSVTP